ncbi:MAG TPA: MerR family transcriptional regulator [Staphylococcus kloosii]|uniref:MerR family transcriptional regulator n=1 Tax=Staphylococcus kloosii TaxID=29384 RepID=A0A921H1E8_9STAP|nr:MerR family transcriptional regulator [Staphylococcus kloosii]HJF67810.1 MerR family transcriptional regulator [Staphylococcus kloosii]
MQIDEVSKRLNIPKSQIRYYEKSGLLSITRDTNGYRFFDDNTLFELTMILNLKKLDLELSEIKYIISLFHKPVTKQCNENSTEFIAKIIQRTEQRLQQQLILSKMKELHELSRNEQYEVNKAAIFSKLDRRHDNHD